MSGGLHDGMMLLRAYVRILGMKDIDGITIVQLSHVITGAVTDM